MADKRGPDLKSSFDLHAKFFKAGFENREFESSIYADLQQHIDIDERDRVSVHVAIEIRNLQSYRIFLWQGNSGFTCQIVLKRTVQSFNKHVRALYLHAVH